MRLCERGAVECMQKGMRLIREDNRVTDPTVPYVIVPGSGIDALGYF